ncbi:methyl-accepting chemotaxis protein [Cohnella zeiphila]|uniref:Cache domain-containing protein n=1 Tax=Cohnella zeiphila TaxID=2761120 RepID=A0A7X0SQU7_9BACL|nr:methyl-accepting chemotaxis protein [Cohnella zeiphila]MBB6734276.1 cache domain-containing protein [Cohnella zeiphila]
MRNMRFTIRTKLLFVMAVLLIVPIVSLGIVALQVSSSETDQQVRTSLRNAVRLAEEIQRSLDKEVQAGNITQEAAEESFRAAILGEKMSDGTRPINTDIDLGANGYFFAMDDKGVMLAHPSKEGTSLWENKTDDGFYYIQNMVKAAQNGGGFTLYSYPLPHSEKLAQKITYSEKAPAWGWIIAAGSYAQDYNAGQRHIVSAIWWTLGICAVVGGAVLTAVSFRLSKPIVRVADRVERIAQGDLTGEALAVGGKDEIGRMAAAYNRLLENLRELAGNQTLSANALAASAAALSKSIAETTEAVHQTSQAISEVAGNNETQAGSFAETAKATEEMAAGVQRIAATSSSAFDASAATLKEAENGDRLISRTIGQMEDVSRTVADLGDVVRRLGDRSQRIDEMAAAIREISSQTNLLSLNASIEAARAGEHGKGFGVVAGEIKKLAVRSDESAAQVGELIDEIRRDIDSALESMRAGEEQVSLGSASIKETGVAFSRILEATKDVVLQVEEATAASEQMAASSEQIAASLTEMERLSAGTATSSQTVSAAAEQQLISLDEIARSARLLSDMSEQSRQLAGRFKL